MVKLGCPLTQPDAHVRCEVVLRRSASQDTRDAVDTVGMAPRRRVVKLLLCRTRSRLELGGLGSGSLVVGRK